MDLHQILFQELSRGDVAAKSRDSENRKFGKRTKAHCKSVGLVQIHTYCPTNVLYPYLVFFYLYQLQSVVFLSSHNSRALFSQTSTPISILFGLLCRAVFRGHTPPIPTPFLFTSTEPERTFQRIKHTCQDTAWSSLTSQRRGVLSAAAHRSDCSSFHLRCRAKWRLYAKVWHTHFPRALQICAVSAFKL
jgi:hypothetical protein